MDGAAPPQSPWSDEPVTLPCGGETLARCAVCGTGFIPASHLSRTCGASCRAALTARTDAARSARTHATHRSYRLAGMALRAAGIDPATVPALATLRGRGDVDGWRALVGLPPERRGSPAPAASRAPGGAPVGAQPEHVAWGLALDGLPTDVSARLVHGLVSRLVAASHTQVARWSLAMPSGARAAGWGVVLYRREDAERLAGRVESVRLGTRAAQLRVGSIVRLRAPAMIEPGRYRVTLDAVTPVSHLVDGRTRAIYAPTVQTILGAAGDITQRLGLRVGTMHAERVMCETAPERVTLGGHMGSVPGWVGRVTVECNAPLAWALACARHTGLGGRVAFGMGRVRITVERA